uniref:Uncharacterized protein n=1 Tax=Arundo donax TaxID=35708 RepID=A0A0A9A737_ARUDO
MSHGMDYSEAKGSGRKWLLGLDWCSGQAGPARKTEGRAGALTGEDLID